MTSIHDHWCKHCGEHLKGKLATALCDRPACIDAERTALVYQRIIVGGDMNRDRIAKTNPELAAYLPCYLHVSAADVSRAAEKAAAAKMHADYRSIDRKPANIMPSGWSGQFVAVHDDDVKPFDPVEWDRLFGGLAAKCEEIAELARDDVKPPAAIASLLHHIQNDLSVTRIRVGPDQTILDLLDGESLWLPVSYETAIEHVRHACHTSGRTWRHEDSFCHTTFKFAP